MPPIGEEFPWSRPASRKWGGEADPSDVDLEIELRRIWTACPIARRAGQSALNSSRSHRISAASVAANMAVATARDFLSLLERSKLLSPDALRDGILLAPA